MLVCDAGDIAVVPFPFSDMAIAKPRPVLALSPRAFNDASGNTLFAMITTVAKSHWPSDIVLSDTDVAGLKASSLVRLKLFTLDNRLVSRKIGVLSQRDRAAIRKTLRGAIAI